MIGVGRTRAAFSWLARERFCKKMNSIDLFRFLKHFADNCLCARILIISCRSVWWMICIEYVNKKRLMRYVLKLKVPSRRIVQMILFWSETVVSCNCDSQDTRVKIRENIKWCMLSSYAVTSCWKKIFLNIKIFIWLALAGISSQSFKGLNC